MKWYYGTGLLLAGSLIALRQWHKSQEGQPSATQAAGIVVAGQPITPDMWFAIAAALGGSALYVTVNYGLTR